MIRSGDDDRIIKSRPSAINSRLPLIAIRGTDNTCFEMKDPFLFGGLPSTLLRALSLSKGSPPNKKIIPLRTPCLGGEISILDESDYKSKRLSSFEKPLLRNYLIFLNEVFIIL